ncbi:MAG: hypothetical protein JWP44_5234 [Mucilaginibacter sp.]|jgi:hypothetical protein|nr:hypothetical protein [Mucilaginibacter sp.]
MDAAHFTNIHKILKLDTSLEAVEIVQGIFREILSRQTGMKTEDVERIEQEVVEAFKGNKVGL